MKKVYFIVPIVLLVAFIFIYIGVRNQIHDQEVARQAQAEQDRKERLIKEDQARKAAYDAANQEAQKRIAEIQAKQAEEKRQAEVRQDATDRRDVAFRERNSLSDQARKLGDDLLAAKEQLTKIQEQIKIQQAQVDYLKTSVTDVTQTKAIFENALQKMDTAEKAFALLQQQQAAAAAPKK